MTTPSPEQAPLSTVTVGAAPHVLAAFLEQVERVPDTTALIVGGQRLTYRELADASAGLAGILQTRGAGPGKVVCVRLDPCALAVVTMLATLRTGAAWCVLEPQLPRTRLEALCRDTHCVAVLTDDELPDLASDAAPPHQLRTADLELPKLIALGAGAGGPTGASVPGPTTAYVIYTSGSTGTPKGVMVSRDSIAVSVADRCAAFDDEPSVFLMAMRLSFDGVLIGIFGALTRGHTLLLPDVQELLRVPDFGRLARENGATHLVAVPSYYRALLEERGLLPSSLRCVIVAGEVCTPELVATHLDRLPGAQLVNEYGPTEATITATAQPDPDPTLDHVPIGRPWPNIRIRVLDERLQPAPPGARGDLYIGGPFVALGYASQPALTAERFVADPYGVAGSRLYRTGDIASVDEEGVVHFHGRSDDQVKIRGSRIEIGEVETVLESHPGLGQAVVVHHLTEGTGQPRLTAFVLPAAPDLPVPDAAELRRHCRGRLVEPAVPSAFVPVDRIPLNTSSKADRPALLRLAVDRQAAAGDAARPRETAAGVLLAVAGIWARVLQHPDSGPDDNFFAVGGSSLRIITLHQHLEERWPGVLRVGELFDLITISDQASTIAERLAAPDVRSRTEAGSQADAGPGPGVGGRSATRAESERTTAGAVPADRAAAPRVSEAMAAGPQDVYEL
ncbi:Tyrocidine synthase 3 [Streptomyces sp. YIM 130001]|uniref:non-ribosomal peptide synthetase n=1 Tax=Streptomyces sp. YIM 130001 TaxID=2259644 RepID=UPI000E64E6AF|nr:non-ribosomal peptide synthetase [Streptomyces sp. YIM 130001]RII13770.1 Tyrocidine synthase 3 [Streptomyces sp. YIM 130001]